jgi:hypothetical protein
VRATEERIGPALRQLPASARQAVAEKAAGRSGQVARDQFARTFADVLSGRFGGSWSVEWQRANRPPAPSHRNRRSLTGEE